MKCYQLFQFDQFDEEHAAVERWALNKWFTYCHVTIGIVASKMRKVDVDRFRGYCFEAMVHLKTFFPWALISYAVHETLGHIADFMEVFGCTGLGHLSEVPIFTTYFRHNHLKRTRKETHEP